MKPNSRVVVDTNVLVSALLISDSAPAACLKYVLESGKLLVSQEILAEYANVLARPKLDKYVSRKLRDKIFDRITVQSELVLVTAPLVICRDPKDDMFLNVAREGKASSILTGDQDLITLNPYEGISILHPSQFLELIKPL